MTNASCIWLPAILLAVVCSTVSVAVRQSATGEQFLGTWAGTWEGAGTGGFELTLEKTGDAVGGNVSVTGEPTYRAVLKTVSFDGPKMTAKYDFPPDEDGEVVLQATFEGKAAKGTWSLRAKASGEEVASGTWAVTRK